MTNRQETSVTLWVYLGIFGALCALCVAIQLSQWNDAWRGSMQLHTMMELFSAHLALFVGGVALLRFYSKKSNMYLFIGLAFLGTALLDGYHMIVTSTFFHDMFPSAPPSLISWSGNPSSTFLSILMVASWWAWRRERRLGLAGRISELKAYTAVGVLCLASFCFFAFFPPPRAYHGELFFGRPIEFVAAALFLIALIGYLRKDEWRIGAFESWVTISLIVGFVSQAAAMSRSLMLFDAMFDLAHMLKIVSYACVANGLMLSMYQLFKQADQSAVRLSRSNDDLQVEVQERKRAEEHLSRRSRMFQHGEEQLRAILDTAVDAIIAIDQRGIVESFNPAAERMFGYSAEEIVGQNISKLMPNPYKREHDGYLQHFLRTGEKKVIGIGREVVGQRKDGSTFPIELAVSEMQVGEKAGFTGIVRDITKRKQAEEELAQHAAELERSNEELEQFAYIASHDLKEPLRMVGSYTQLLAEEYEGKLDEEADKYIGYATDGAKRMQELIDALLQYSRVGRDNAPMELIDLENTAKLVLANLEIARREADAHIDIGPLPTIRGSRTEMLQLFQNLIGNALKFRGDEDPVVTISCEANDDEWQITVADNGIGIEPEYCDRIFQIFQRLHTRDEYPGTGIGLSMCKKIVEHHGGRIWIESEPGEGTSFHFTLHKEPIAPRQIKEPVLV